MRAGGKGSMSARSISRANTNRMLADEKATKISSTGLNKPVEHGTSASMSARRQGRYPTGWRPMGILASPHYIGVCARQGGCSRRGTGTVLHSLLQGRANDLSAVVHGGRQYVFHYTGRCRHSQKDQVDVVIADEELLNSPITCRDAPTLAGFVLRQR